MSKLYLFSVIFFSFLGMMTAQLTIKIVSIPSNTPDNAPIYIVGNFNNWNPENADYQLQATTGNIYEITFNPPIGQLEYKFTRGGWETVEGNVAGGFLPNRSYNYEGGEATIQVEVSSWEDLGGTGIQPSTATDNVFIFDKNIYIPQLNRNRRIWIYLPPDYFSTEKRYPVFYMHDGQNIFDLYTSFSGEWGIDESLNNLFENGDSGAIVVGIDNGGASRIDEYSPWENANYGGGEGDEYMEFVVETLKPLIDKNYRTRPERTSTGILGSSMGGLISLYGAIEYQEVFGKAGIFSPSLWFSSLAYSHITEMGKEADMKFYLLAGEQEGNGSVADAVEALEETLLNAGFSNEEIFLDIDQDGQHSEWYWKREFPAAYQWLCANVNTNTPSIEKPSFISIFPNPSSHRIQFELHREVDNLSYKVLSLTGQELLQGKALFGLNSIEMTPFPDSIYLLQLHSDKKIIWTERVSIQQ